MQKSTLKWCFKSWQVSATPPPYATLIPFVTKPRSLQSDQSIPLHSSAQRSQTAPALLLPSAGHRADAGCSQQKSTPSSGSAATARASGGDCRAQGVLRTGAQSCSRQPAPVHQPVPANAGGDEASSGEVLLGSVTPEPEPPALGWHCPVCGGGGEGWEHLLAYKGPGYGQSCSPARHEVAVRRGSGEGWTCGHSTVLLQWM